jgi:exosome complex component RRP40
MGYASCARLTDSTKVGTLIFGRVSLANRDMEPEIECFDASTGKSEGFGELKGGLMVQLSLEMCRQ